MEHKLPMVTLLFASGNKKKHEELNAAFKQANLAITITSLPPQYSAPDENATDFIGNALIKAKAALHAMDNKPDLVLAEDAGLEVMALAGTDDLTPFPGVRSNRWLTKEVQQKLFNAVIAEEPSYENLNQGLLTLLKGSTNDRAAQFTSAMVLLDSMGNLVFKTQQHCPLQVINQNELPQGCYGFGYDPIVYPVINGKVADKTMAELTTEEKNSISHRGKALQELFKFLTLYQQH